MRQRDRKHVTNATHLEDGFLVATRRHDVRVRLLLDAFDRSTFGSDHQPHHSVRHAHLQQHSGRLLVGVRCLKQPRKLPQICNFNFPPHDAPRREPSATTLAVITFSRGEWYQR